MPNLKSTIRFVVGDNDLISSDRYFVIVFVLVSSIFLLGLSLTHLLMGLKLAPVILAGSSSLVMLGLYYFVRFRTCLIIPKVILTCLGLIMLDITWYSKFLSNGPVLFFILIFAALVIWVWEGKWLAIFLGFYFLNLAVLFYIDYNAPEELFRYPDPELRSVDIFLSLLMYSILLTLLLYIVKQEFIRQKENAVKSDMLKSAFLANMSHEIRTPMNGIIGFAELLKDPILKKEDQQEYIKIIEESGDRMLNIINDIIDISKIQSGLMKLNIVESDVNDQIEYIYAFFKPEIEAKGIQFSFHIALPSKEARITTDREKLYAILTNLVKNAIKYTRAGSIDLGYSVKGKFLEFYLKDTGVGIPKDRQIAVFERFIQSDITDMMAQQGAGLGLSITKAYVEMLGGRIWVDSEVGQGSTFYFTIPYVFDSIEKKIIKKPDVSEIIENQSKSLKILIAEDDDISQKLIVIAVKKFGNDIIKVHTGADAVEGCRANPDLDLILMDIKMPGMDGYEATRLIREFNKKVVIIAQTAFGLSGDRDKALDAGCNDYISKPIDTKKLQSLIIKHLFDK